VRLYLVRHGESLTSELDPNQPLSEQGIKETEAVAELLKEASIEIDEIIHSTKLRAKQTAEILCKVLAPELTLTQKEWLKPMDPIEPLLTEIRSFDHNVMLVGHLPFIEKLLLVLLTQAINPVKLDGSCVICLSGDGKSWQIEWLVSPKLCYAHFVQKKS